MLTVVIETLNDEEALAATLAALVPAAVEGLVCEVIVHDRGSSDATVWRLATRPGARWSGRVVSAAG